MGSARTCLIRVPGAWELAMSSFLLIDAASGDSQDFLQGLNLQLITSPRVTSVPSHFQPTPWLCPRTAEKA